jgi:uncharacterized protein YjbI with pentapeptide repeats
LVDYGISGGYVAWVLEAIGQFRSLPRAIRTDRGPEFTSRARADLRGTTFIHTNLAAANLEAAKLDEAAFGTVIFGDTVLLSATGLETCNHLGGSSIDFRTLAQSGHCQPLSCAAADCRTP